MHVYTKDDSGHPSSPLNGQLDGLFFLARLNINGTFPETSPFGDTRWFTKAENLFHPDSHRLYFADFYCKHLTSSNNFGVLISVFRQLPYPLRHPGYL